MLAWMLHGVESVQLPEELIRRTLITIEGRFRLSDCPTKFLEAANEDREGRLVEEREKGVGWR